MPFEKGGIGEHRNSRRTAFFILARRIGGIQIRTGESYPSIYGGYPQLMPGAAAYYSGEYN